jgi:hypothetical protein
MTRDASVVLTERLVLERFRRYSYNVTCNFSLLAAVIFLSNLLQVDMQEGENSCWLYEESCDDETINSCEANLLGSRDEPINYLKSTKLIPKGLDVSFVKGL